MADHNSEESVPQFMVLKKINATRDGDNGRMRGLNGHRNKFEPEIEVCKAFPSHPNMVKLIATSVADSSTFKGQSELTSGIAGYKYLNLLFEYCPGGNVVEWLNEKRKSPRGGVRMLGSGSNNVPSAENSTDSNSLNTVEISTKFNPNSVIQQEADLIADCFYQICSAVLALHHHHIPPIIHRDLKAENVLVGYDGKLKLCDFGSCVFLTDDLRAIYARDSVSNSAQNPHRLKVLSRLEEDFNENTTPAYRAPEIVDFYRDEELGLKIDIWALGVLLYSLMFNRLPFGGMEMADDSQDSSSMRLAILSGKYEMPSSNDMNHSCWDDLKQLIGQCLQQAPNQRPKIHSLVRTLSTLTGETCPEDILNLAIADENSRSRIANQNQHSLDIQGSTMISQSGTKLQLDDSKRRGRRRPANVASESTHPNEFLI